MPALSDYVESGFLNHLFRGVPFGIPNNISIALTSGVPLQSHTGSTIPEVSRLSMGSSGVPNGYARVHVSTSGNRSTQWSYTSANHGNESGVIRNPNQVVFNTALTDWGPVSGIAVLDNSGYGSGNLLMYAQLENPRQIYTGDSIKFSSNELKILLQ